MSPFVSLPLFLEPSLKQLSKDIKNPIKLPSILFSEASARFSSQTLTAIPNELSEARDLISSRTKAFGRAVEGLVTTYGKDVVEQQLHLQRVANGVIDLYAMTAATSRATRSLSQNLPSAQHEKRLAKVICRQAAHRIDLNIAEISLGKKHPNDADVSKIADEVFAHEGYIPSHPVAARSD